MHVRSDRLDISELHLKMMTWSRGNVVSKLFRSFLSLDVQLAFANFIIAFLSDYLGDTKTISRPFALKGHGSIANSASPHGLLTRSPSGYGLRV